MRPAHILSSSARRTTSFSLLAASLAFAGCGESTPAEAPSAPLEAPTAAPTSSAWQVATDGSAVDFVMEAPLENIHGRAPNSVAGELELDLGSEQWQATPRRGAHHDRRPHGDLLAHREHASEKRGRDSHRGLLVVGRLRSGSMRTPAGSSGKL